jgi:hypothetical protein
MCAAQRSGVDPGPGRPKSARRPQLLPRSRGEEGRPDGKPTCKAGGNSRFGVRWVLGGTAEWGGEQAEAAGLRQQGDTKERHVRDSGFLLYTLIWSFTTKPPLPLSLALKSLRPTLFSTCNYDSKVKLPLLAKLYTKIHVFKKLV